MSAQAGQSFAHSTAPIRAVREVQFGILSPEEIVRISLAMLHHRPCPGTMNAHGVHGDPERPDHRVIRLPC